MNFNYSNKKDFIEYFPQTINNYAHDHHVFFVTYTFKDMKTSYSHSSYSKAFDYLYQKYDSAISLRSSDYKKAPILMLVPETNPAVHFHGFLLVNKTRDKRFYSKCVEFVKYEYNDKIKRQAESIILKDKFYQPYPRSKLNNYYADKATKQKTLNFPHFHSQTLYRLANTDDMNSAANYSCKNFLKYNYTCDDLIIKKKLKSKKLKCLKTVL